MVPSFLPVLLAAALARDAKPGGIVMADPPNAAAIYVARVNSDGTIATACVATEQAARDFMSGKKKPAGPEKE